MTDDTPNQTYTQLQNRGLVHLEGDDRVSFLQGLVSNDISNIPLGQAVYACLLSPQGKFLHDFFVIAGHDFFMLECEGGDRAQDLYKRLNLYRLRSKVKLSVEDSVPVYAIFTNDKKDMPPQAYKDPRHPLMGYRNLNTAPETLTESGFEAWDRHRITLGIPDGSRDMEIQRSSLAECNIDKINGVSYTKGCFVGQELTARMHNRGLAKRHLYPVQIHNPDLKSGDPILIAEKPAGTLRSTCGDIGLASLKDSALDNLTENMFVALL